MREINRFLLLGLVALHGGVPIVRKRLHLSVLRAWFAGTGTEGRRKRVVQERSH